MSFGIFRYGFGARSRRVIRGQQAGDAVYEMGSGFDGGVGGRKGDGSLGPCAVVGERLQLIGPSQKFGQGLVDAWFVSGDASELRAQAPVGLGDLAGAFVV